MISVAMMISTERKVCTWSRDPNHRSAGSDDQNEMIRDSTTLSELFEFNAVSQLDALKKSHKINETRSEALPS